MRGWNEAWGPVFENLGRMRAAWPTRGWSWDSRLNCITSSFTVTQEPMAKTAATFALQQEWTSTTMPRAPAPLRGVIERAGGVRQGQLVLSTGPVANLLLYGLWWPWGDNETVSLRVGLADVDPGRELYQRLRDLFGVTL